MQKSKTNYQTYSRGQGPLVVLLHGWPVNSHHWRYLVPQLTKAGYQTLCIDLKGLGKSKTKDTNFEKKIQARELLKLIAKLNPDSPQYSVIGHDWGGSVAIAMAALAPKKVFRLIIEDEIPPGINVNLSAESRRRYSTWHGAFHRTPHLPELLIAGREDHYINFFLNLRYDPKKLKKKDREYFLKDCRGSQKIESALGYYRCNQADAKFFRELQIKKIKTPALGIAGNFGMGGAVVDSLASFTLHCKGVILKNCGHYPAEERPREFNRLVLKFLKG